jgi:histone H4
MENVPPPPPEILGSRASSRAVSRASSLPTYDSDDDVPLSLLPRGRVLSPPRVAPLVPRLAPVASDAPLSRRIVQAPIPYAERVRVEEAPIPGPSIPAPGPSIPAPGPSIPVARPTTGGKGFMSRPTTTPMRHSRKGNKTGNIKVVSQPAVRRLARRAGVKRISGEIYEETQNVAKEFLTKVLEKSCIYMTDRNKDAVTLNPSDVVRALNNMGLPIYGFDPR